MNTPPEPTDELLGVLHLASELTGRLRHAEVTPEHVLMAMARDPTAARALYGTGVDPRHLEADLREFVLLTAMPSRSWQLLGPSYAPSLRRLLDQTVRRLTDAGRDTVTVGDVLAAIFRAEVPSAVAMSEQPASLGWAYRESPRVIVHPLHRLRQSGFSLVDLLGWIAHGSAMQAWSRTDRGADSDAVWVVLYNDDFTPLAFVQDVLHNDFGMPVGEAEGLSLSVHVHGSEVVAECFRATAVTRVRAATERARAAGFPLRITVEDDAMAAPAHRG